MKTKRDGGQAPTAFGRRTPEPDGEATSHVPLITGDEWGKATGIVPHIISTGIKKPPPPVHVDYGRPYTGVNAGPDMMPGVPAVFIRDIDNPSPVDVMIEAVGNGAGAVDEMVTHIGTPLAIVVANLCETADNFTDGLAKATESARAMDAAMSELANMLEQHKGDDAEMSRAIARLRGRAELIG